MSADFSDKIILSNTARVLRSDVLPAMTDEAVRITIIQMIAVIEKHLVTREESDVAGSDVEQLDAKLASDAGQLAAFRGRLADPPDGL